MFKNTASQKLTVFAFDSTTNLPKTGDAANITAYVSKDNGSVTVLGDTSATEMDSTNAKGYYLFDLTQAETNADQLLFSAKSSTSNIVVIGVPAMVYTLPVGFTATVAQTGDSYARLGAPAGASVSADIAEIEVETDDIALIKLKTDNLPNTPAGTGDAMTLTSAYDAAKTAAQAGDAMALTSGERNSTADALLDRSNAIETGITPRIAFRVGVAADAGKTNGMDTTTGHIRDVADTLNRVTATLDGAGNRTATSINGA